MAIPISTNFDVMTSIPIDSRLVKSDITSRNAISNTWRYIGLTVYVVSDQCDYRLIGGISNSNWQKVTASFAESASWAPSSGGGSGVTPGGSYNISASWASSSISASYAPSGIIIGGGSYNISASWASSSISSSWALTASYISNMSGSNQLYLQSTDGNTYPLSLVNYSGSTILTIGQTPVTGTNNFLNIGTISPLITGSTYPITSSWAISVINGGGVTPGGSYDISASWASSSLSASYVLTSSVSVSSSMANTASYVQGGNVIGTVMSASYSKNAQLIIDMDWHLSRNSNTSLQTTHNFVPGTMLLARNGILCTADYINTEYDYCESGSNQLQLHFTMSENTKMMAVYSLSQ